MIQRRPAHRLIWMAAAAGLAASAVGVLTEAAYRADEATEAMLRGFDLTTVVVVVPLLALGQRGGPLAVLRPGLLAYLVYSSLFAAVAGGLGASFLLAVATTCSASVALACALAELRPASEEKARRTGAVLLLLLAASLGGMWLAAGIGAAIDGEAPAGSALVETDLVVRLGIVLDLWLLVPLYAVAGALLWRAHRWGRPLGLLAAVSGLVHQLSYLVAMQAQVRADVPEARGFDPLEPVIVAVYLAVGAPLVRDAIRDTR